jgi:PadR family transcriptional regulator PadR
MPRGDLLGSLEHIVFLALVRLEANAYGMTIRREIEERTGRNISIGAGSPVLNVQL